MTKKDKIKIDKKKESRLLKGQVVETAKPKEEKKPLKSRYLAEYNNRTKKETSTRKRLNTKILADKLKTPNKKLQNESRKNKSKDEKIASVLKKNSKSKNEKPEKEKIKRGIIAGFNGKKGKELKGALKAERGKISAKDDKNKRALEAASGRIPNQYLPQINGNNSFFASPSNDYIKEEESDEVSLNTRKFAYAKYFNDIKTAISHYWKPSHILYANDPFGTIYNKKDKFTKLKITINKLGFIKNIIVVEASGVDALDREAINAFKRAAPFGDAPKILLDSDENFSFEFGFYLYGQKSR